MLKKAGFFKICETEKNVKEKDIDSSHTVWWGRATGNFLAMEQSVNCTGHRKKVEVYAANFFTNGFFLQTLDNGVSFHDALALEVLSGHVNKTILLDTTYCYTQWQRGFSLKADTVIPLCITCPEKGGLSFSPFTAIFLCPRGLLTKQKKKRLEMSVTAKQ